MTSIKRISGAVVALVLLGGCREVTVPNYNSPSVNALTGNPTASVVNTAAQGLFIQYRAGAGVEGWPMGSFGREAVNLLQAEPRDLLGYYAGPLEPSGFASDLGWSAAYTDLREAQAIQTAVDKVASYTATQKEAIHGFVQTFVAMELLRQIKIRDTSGLVVDVGTDPLSLGQVLGKDAVLLRIGGMLDSAQVHLQAGGSAFPFQLTSGFAGFNTPATFLLVNRGMKARVDLYRKQWSAVLADLAASFTDTSSGSAANLSKGAYNVWSSASGDVPNPFYDPTPNAIYVHPSIVSGAQTRANGSPDLRLTNKTAVGTTRTLQGVTGTMKFTVYKSQSDPSPILKNEELILMRAEANYNLGNTAAAIADINFIRVNSGGLAPLPANYSGDLLGEILYNRTYSLLFEQGTRWVDARRYGRLGQLPRQFSSIAEKVYPYVMFPDAECNQRNPKPQPGCSQVPAM